MLAGWENQESTVTPVGNLVFDEHHWEVREVVRNRVLQLTP